VDNAAGFRVKGSGVADPVAGDIEALGKKEADIPGCWPQIFHHHLAEIDVLVEIHGIAAGEQNPQFVVKEIDLSHHGVRRVEKIPAPLRADPAEEAVSPDPKAAEVPGNMVLLTNMGKKQIANEVLLVKADQKMTVSHRNITWHGGLPYGGLLWRLLFDGLAATQKNHISSFRRRPKSSVFGQLQQGWPPASRRRDELLRVHHF